MKTLSPLVSLIMAAGLLVGSLRAQSPAERPPVPSMTDGTSRFIFYSVLEGLYEDGVPNADVDRILLQTAGGAYEHFIYSCPVCAATIWALQSYRARPGVFYSLKDGSTFGPGLPAPLHEALQSEDSQRRLAAINALMQTWMDRRVQAMHLSEAEHARLLTALEAKRQEGMDALESFRRGGHGPNFGVEQAAPAYANLTECAVCNGAVGKPMKLPADPAPPK